MSESWESRRNRLVKVRAGFSESLRNIPLRYVEDVAGLSPEALRALERAYQVEPVNIPRAIQYIRENLVLSVEDLREFARPEKPGPKPAGTEIQELNASLNLKQPVIPLITATYRHWPKYSGCVIRACQKYPHMRWRGRR